MKNPRANSGFSLLEVMIAVLIVGVALVALTQGISTALSSGKESELQTTAALFASGKIEKLRADTGLTDEQTEGTCGDMLPLYQWKQSVTPTRIDGLHEVTVVVESTRTGQAIYELRTMLFERPEDTSDKRKSSNSRKSRMR
jgi:prepilin-type N-terminal cleavage/methylation domain-containing protein